MFQEILRESSEAMKESIRVKQEKLLEEVKQMIAIKKLIDRNTLNEIIQTQSQ
jgi:hypothetical protein